MNKVQELKFPHILPMSRCLLWSCDRIQLQSLFRCSSSINSNRGYAPWHPSVVLCSLIIGNLMLSYYRFE